MATIPTTIAMNWKTSVHITARIPPYNLKTPFTIIANHLLFDAWGQLVNVFIKSGMYAY